MRTNDNNNEKQEFNLSMICEIKAFEIDLWFHWWIASVFVTVDCLFALLFGKIR